MKKVVGALFLLVCALCNTSQIKTVSVDEFAQLLQQAPPVQLVDVRTPQEFTACRIGGARNVDFRDTNFRAQIEKLDKTKPMLVCCLSGKRSGEALKVFREAGFTTVYKLDGGINAWSEAGKPLEQGVAGKDELSQSDYEAVAASEGSALIIFHATWCSPCRKMLPMLNELSAAYPARFKLLTVDIEKNKLLVKEKGVAAVPYFMAFKNGVKVWERQGAATREEVMQALGIKK